MSEYDRQEKKLGKVYVYVLVGSKIKQIPHILFHIFVVFLIAAYTFCNETFAIFDDCENVKRKTTMFICGILQNF